MFRSALPVAVAFFQSCFQQTLRLDRPVFGSLRLAPFFLAPLVPFYMLGSTTCSASVGRFYLKRPRSSRLPRSVACCFLGFSDDARNVVRARYWKPGASAITSHNRVLTRRLRRDIPPSLSLSASRPLPPSITRKQPTTCSYDLPPRHHAEHGAGSARARARHMTSACGT